jgi:pimeloyl-ACP methyl ester carboxylesterase
MLTMTDSSKVRGALAGVLVALFALAAAAAPARFEPHRFQPQSGEAVDAELGAYDVPENRSRPGSRTLTLRFVRFKSTSANPGNPIVYLAGGPGGSGIGAASSGRFALFMALRELGDVIAWDMRGVNRSDPQTGCEGQLLLPLGQPLDRTVAGTMVAGAMRKCAAARPEVDVSALNAREAAADLNDLRLALGAKKLVLWGISFGTHLAIATVRYQPEAIERVILAGIEGPDDTYKLPSDQQLLMEDIARLAAQQGKHPDLLAAIQRVLRELEARPKSVVLTHPGTGQSGPVVVGRPDLQNVLAGMLFGPDSFATMPDLITRLEQGDWTALALASAGGRMMPAPTLLQIAMDCASGMSGERRQRIAAEAKVTLLGDIINFPFPEACAGLNVPVLEEAFRGPLVSEVPALLISGTLDGRTRPRQAEELRLTMPNAQHLVIEHAGHSDPLFLSSPKILEAMTKFLRGEPIGDRYIPLPVPQFGPVRKFVTLPDAVLERYAGTYRFEGGVVRRVVKAGPVLFTVREGQRPFAIRPMSETEFFYEGQNGTIRFDRDGKTAYMQGEGTEVKGVRE